MLRAGFWRRAFAVLFDFVLVAVAVQLAAVILFPITGGRAQSSSGFHWNTCRRLTTLPPDLQPPPTFAANYATTCVLTLFGAPVARLTRIGRSTRDGTVTKDVSVTFMVDEDGHRMTGFPLDAFIGPLLIALRWIGDRHGGSPGRRLCRSRVVDALPPNEKPPARALARRYLLFAAPGFLTWLVSLYGGFVTSFALIENPIYRSAWLGSVILGSALNLWAIAAIARRRDTFYDRFAGTAVCAVPGVPAPSRGDAGASNEHA